MPNTFNFRETIEADLVDMLQTNTSYTVDRFYNTYSPEALYEEVKAKLGAGNGTVLVRYSETQYDGLDTFNKMYSGTPTVEILVAFPSNKEASLPNQPRTIYEIAQNVSSELIDYELDLDGDTFHLFLLRDQQLFRDINVDAMLLTMGIENYVVEF